MKTPIDAAFTLPLYWVVNITIIDPAGRAVAIVNCAIIKLSLVNKLAIKYAISGIIINFINDTIYIFILLNTYFIGISANEDPINIIDNGIVISPIIDNIFCIVCGTSIPSKNITKAIIFLNHLYFESYILHKSKLKH